MKHINKILSIVITLLVITLAGILYFSNENTLTAEVIAESEQEIDGNTRLISSDELHWNHMPLTYHYNTLPSDACEDCTLVCATSQKEKIKNAFDQITEDTENIIAFEESETNADIEIYCYGDKYSGEGNLITLGEGGYQNYGNEIVSGTLNFYGQNSIGKDSNCLELTLHEIFHVFGFQHSEEGIMKAIATSKISGSYRCQYDIDEYIIEDLKRIYE
jgi:uncharacterized protein YpmB